MKFRTNGKVCNKRVNTLISGMLTVLKSDSKLMEDVRKLECAGKTNDKIKRELYCKLRMIADFELCNDDTHPAFNKHSRRLKYSGISLNEFYYSGTCAGCSDMHWNTVEKQVLSEFWGECVRISKESE